MALVEIKNLKKYFYGPKGAVHAVDDVTMSIDAGDNGSGRGMRMWKIYAGKNREPSSEKYRGLCNL